MLKKIIIIAISLAAAGAAGWYLSNLVHDKAVTPEELPTKAQSFINGHFSGTSVAFCKQDRDFLKVSYEAILTDGTKLEFRHDGEWKEIDMLHARIPDGIIPQEVTSKILELYPDSFVTKAERDSRELEVELDNRLDLKFDRRNNLIGIDR